MNVRNQVLRKLVKLHNSQNVNQYDYINVSKHSRVYLMGAFLIFFGKVHLKVYLIVLETLKQIHQLP
ncbi:hypothetical protein AL506_004045 [Streptococcus sp. FDAARGOS_146]|nr:hypothetical protein AL506_004045 [Streptococcus sp. FDAARGOS_146]